MRERKGRPTPKRDAILAERRVTRGRNRSRWQDQWERAAKATKERRAERAKALKGTRGVDRVPDGLKIDPPAPTVLVEHTDVPASWRRAQRGFTGRPPGGGFRHPSPPRSTNEPRRNPDKDRALPGKARIRARREARRVAAASS
jgi:hypothetical protein